MTKTHCLLCLNSHPFLRLPSLRSLVAISQHVRMQPRISFTTVRHTQVRDPTSFATPRIHTPFSFPAIEVCHATPNWHGCSIWDSRNACRMKTCPKKFCMPSRIRSRPMTTGETARQEAPVVYQQFRGIESSREARKSTDALSNSLTTLPMTKDGSELRYAPENRTSLNRSNTTMKVRRMKPQRIGRVAFGHLSAWLYSKTRAQRAAIWAGELHRHLQKPGDFSLPQILLYYLERAEISPSERAPLATTLDKPVLKTLQRLGFNQEDVELWVYILTARSYGDFDHQHINCNSRIPNFILLEALRRPYLSTSSFHFLLARSFDVVGVRATPLPSDYVSEVTDIVPDDNPPPFNQSEHRLEHKACPLEISAFESLSSRLVHHACQVLPAALPSISEMVVSYCQRLLNHELKTVPRVSRRLCKTYNMMLSCLAQPATVSPFKSMAYNWEAQRILLESAAEFQPHLQLNRSSYRALVQVLLAARKSSSEKRFARLMQRTWPPWRKELDGMDNIRSPAEDISRVVAVLSQMTEAGYAPEETDKAMKILGGREPDGTPTIQTRQLTNTLEQSLLNPRSEGSGESGTIWPARIIATRDVYEAWAAFRSFLRDDQRPSQEMYRAMLEKLIYRNMMRTELHQSNEVLPGDARGPVLRIDDNTSNSEKLRSEPPSVHDLYSQMIVDGHRPSGRLLNMLISNAASLEKVAMYMRNSTLPSKTFVELMRIPTKMRISALKSIPPGTFKAFIKFLCRPRHRVLKSLPGRNVESEPVVRFQRRSDPTIHAFELVRRRRSSKRTVWHLIFDALSQREFTLDDNCDQHGNDVASWRLIEEALGECLKSGISVDPDGFQQLCVGLEKALRSSPVGKGRESELDRGLKLVKDIFANLTLSGEPVHGIPRLLWRLVGCHLHSYIRVLGYTKDVDEAMVVLEWMVKHQEELSKDAEQSQSGMAMLRRVVVAIRAFFGLEDSEEAVVCLKDLMAQIDVWGGWPSDEEVEFYLARDNLGNSSTKVSSPPSDIN